MWRDGHGEAEAEPIPSPTRLSIALAVAALALPAASAAPDAGVGVCYEGIGVDPHVGGVADAFVGVVVGGPALVDVYGSREEYRAACCEAGGHPPDCYGESRAASSGASALLLP